MYSIILSIALAQNPPLDHPPGLTEVEKLRQENARIKAQIENLHIRTDENAESAQTAVDKAQKAVDKATPPPWWDRFATWIGAGIMGCLIALWAFIKKAFAWLWRNRARFFAVVPAAECVVENLDKTVDVLEDQYSKGRTACVQIGAVVSEVVRNRRLTKDQERLFLDSLQNLGTSFDTVFQQVQIAIAAIRDATRPIISAESQ